MPRLDNRLVETGLAPTRQKAQAYILAGLVYVDGLRAAKAAQEVGPEARLEVRGKDHPYVSRGGVKLAHALDAFHLDPAGRRCLDLGASSGGFTDCLLQRGAAEVVAVDVGYGQLDLKLRQDPRVKVLERTNARYLSLEMIGGPVAAVVADLAFISLTLVLPPVWPFLRPGGWLAALVKPQFEAGKGQVGKGGVVKDPALQAQAVAKVVACLEELGATVLGSSPSPIRGPKGNQEYLVGARK